MKTIELSNYHEVALVDDDDYDRLIKHRWWYGSSGYAISSACGKNTKMCHFIYKLHCIEIPSGYGIDHEDRNKLNYQKYNLRLATRNQQQWNKGIQSNNISGYKGVSFSVNTNKWQAGIQYEEETIYLGVFRSAEDAAKAYDCKALELFGKFAVLNFPGNYVRSD